jgi:N-acetylmuramoyl-L-alanine amidase
MHDPFRLVLDIRAAVAAAIPEGTDSGRSKIEETTTLRVRGADGSRPQGSEPVLVSARRDVGRPSAAAPAAPVLSRKRFKIVVDPGHGGKDPGAIGAAGVAEKDVVLAIARQLRRTLLATGDFEVVLTRDGDVYLPLQARTALANREKADLFISIHANASPKRDRAGAETYYLSDTEDRATLRLAEMENGLRSMTGAAAPDRDAAVILSSLIQNYKIEESLALAEDVQRGLVGALRSNGTPVEDLGVKSGPFYVLVGAGMPCVLVEASFITHPREGRRLAQPSYQNAVARGLLQGIRRFAANARVAENL